ncbi:glycoside hydrolase family 3 N-terminal domain-containing protein [Mumia sp. DW29H23]|uniref:glycoside hydrolase family 3 N-terminal domain-containing protein n=1 Tax=Mumia sp. DW29H23 TaxID=3421241 RepID=UPI003D682E97
MSSTRVARRLALGLSAAFVITGCSDTSPRPGAGTSEQTSSASPSTGSASTPSASTGTPSAPPATPSAATPTALAGLTLPQVVGQVFMTGTSPSSAEDATLASIREQHVGNVMLRGRSDDGVATTARVVRTLRGAVSDDATGSIPLLVATDQEGGAVQVLRGRGFSDIPSALTQGRWSVATVRSRAATWGRRLRAAGVDLNLAPVLDTVPSPAFAPRNAPIGAYDRQYGFTPQVVSSKGLAFFGGMEDAGVVATVKHFPGLGRVTANTDTSDDVHDTRTTSTDPYLQPFADAIAAGARVVMMATATYDRIDPREPAAFSRPIVTGLLRDRMGFDGVVMSDDLSAAQQVKDRSPAERAVDFLRAGGDLVLAIDPAQMPEMTAAVVAEARKDPAFAARVQEAAARVVALKRDHAAG